MARDFSTISPSARWLLKVRAHTTLPYAREAAEIVFRSDEASESDPVRLRHFELRARSLDEVLDEVAIENVLELAAGFRSEDSIARRGRASITWTRIDRKLAPSSDPWRVRETWMMTAV